jgi:hypothetical protein
MGREGHTRLLRKSSPAAGLTNPRIFMPEGKGEMKVPIDLIDGDGYPTQEWLRFLREYRPSDELPLKRFVEEMLPSGWWYSERQMELFKPYRGKRKLILHTGGWSGNEEAIGALLSNRYLLILLRYRQWNAGGHYRFEYST